MDELPRPIVDVVIPCYNYAENVVRAINSVKSQTVNNLACYIVDDGSTDNTAKVVQEAIKDDRRFHYIYQSNAGVANARNNGVFTGTGKYVCCLDADDALDPEFLMACVKALEDDPDIDIAYTGLHYIKPDGEDGLSPWPGENDYDAQLEGRNQIPTCNVARREVWERLGGQRQRYAPMGAGEEDAEMWLRMGAYGFKAKKVTSAGLFIYSWMSGRVSGSKTHRITDYRAWHPWTRDFKHPLVSLAKPKYKSHPVRQYDEPVVSVIIPVGPGHETDVIDALDSLEGQAYRKWEAIIVWDSDEDYAFIQKVYPYAVIVDSTARNAGRARNIGAEYATAPFLMFLDADDWLDPEAIDMMVSEWTINEGIIYSDYVGRAYITDPIEIQKLKDQDRLIFHDEETGRTVTAHQAEEYNCNKAVKQPDRDLYIWNLVTSLVPKVWHDDIGGFDEEMDSWEDWDYYIRMAKAGYCFYRVPERLVVYRFYTGYRREHGLQDHRELLKYMTNKYRDIEIMPCNCKGRRTQAPPRNTDMTKTSPATYLQDENFVLAEYTHRNTGQHRVVGPASGRDYGYRAGGDRFLVDKIDVQSQPHLYRVVEIKEKPAPPPPTTPSVVTPPPKIDSDVETFNLQKVAGITPEIEEQLTELGITSPEDIVEFGEANLIKKIKGVGKARASAIMSAVNQTE